MSCRSSRQAESWTTPLPIPPPMVARRRPDPTPARADPTTVEVEASKVVEASTAAWRPGASWIQRKKIHDDMSSVTSSGCGDAVCCCDGLPLSSANVDLVRRRLAMHGSNEEATVHARIR